VGLRAWKSAAGAPATYYLYDGGVPVCEFSLTGSFLASNTFGADGLLSRRSNRGTPASTFYSFDQQGSVSQRLDASGNVLTSYLFDHHGFGQTTDPPSTEPWGYGAQFGHYTNRAGIGAPT